jgi:UPF0271 protein
VAVMWEAFGDAAWRARLPAGANGRAVLDALRALPGVVDAIVSERHALVTFDPKAPPTGTEAAVARALWSESAPNATRQHVVRVRYDGEDLDEVARAAGLRPEEVVARHAAQTYAVAAVGFLPGFAYLRELDPKLVLPRRATPRPRIAALSVGIAGPYTGIYPFASPGGWNIIGTAVEFTPFDARFGATLNLGDHVLFATLVSP